MSITLREQLKAFDKGIILDSKGDENSCFNFYDWFCKDSSLERKAKKLFPKVKRFLKHYKDIDTTKVYVFFKNNCPMNGRLYDDFRICDIETGDVLYTVTPKSGHTNSNGEAELWGKENDFREVIKTASSFTGLFK